MKITKSKLKQIIKEEIGQSIKEEVDPPAVYAYVETPYDGALIITTYSKEEAQEEGAGYGDVRAIFTADIIEGEL